MLEGLSSAFILTLLLIGASVIDDLRSRKVHNSLVTSIFVVSLWSAFALFGTAAAPQIAVSIVGAFAFCLPLYLLRVVGGGDVKLIIAISPLWAWSDIAWTLAYSLVWGAILGVLMVFLRKEGRAFLQNLFSLALTNPVEKKQLHKIPYTIAIFFGFLTHWSLLQKGISLL
ncbi:MAG: prepilin peptidase [Bdellovibrionaceae bacterium]|nr:prepilin peptidase [Pseudobdellovibrionaceae bacterium]